MALNKNAQKWVRALRSGAFQQGQNKLAGDGKFCCLGVACVLAAADGIIPPAHTHDDGRLGFAGEAHYLPRPVIKWLGLKDKRGTISATKYGPSTNLAIMNDNSKTFEEIASVIESEPSLFRRNRRKARRKS
jgi:hypothetical protein